MTGAAVTVDVHASYLDYNGTDVTPGRKNTAISTAVTTDVVGSPGASTYRNVRSLKIRNRHATLSVLVTVVHTDGTTAVELYETLLGPGAVLQYTDGAGFFIRETFASPLDWHGNLYACYGRCDPQQMLRMATMGGSVAPTPTNIGTSVARLSYFRPPADIVVNKVRHYGVGATTNVYRIALYDGDSLARLTAEQAFTTVANAWGEVFSNLGLTLSKDQLYFIAVSVNATGTTAGVLAMGATPGATTGAVNVLPKTWPGNLSVDAGYMDGGLAQFAVTSGALPDPAPTIAAQPTNWTGGMPLFFLDNNNS